MTEQITEQQPMQLNIDDLFKIIGELHLQLRMVNQRIAQLEQENNKLKEEKQKDGDKI